MFKNCNYSILDLSRRSLETSDRHAPRRICISCVHLGVSVRNTRFGNRAAIRFRIGRLLFLCFVFDV